MRISQSDCNAITHKLDTRPRKRHGYKTPIQRLKQLSGVLRFKCQFTHYRPPYASALRPEPKDSARFRYSYVPWSERPQSH